MKVRKSSGNVFSDLGFPEPEASSLRFRARLMAAVAKNLKDLGKSQTALAADLGLHQSQVSDLLNRRIDRFSLDRLVDLASQAGVSVEVSVSTQEESDLQFDAIRSEGRVVVESEGHRLSTTGNVLTFNRLFKESDSVSTDYLSVLAALDEVATSSNVEDSLVRISHAGFYQAEAA